MKRHALGGAWLACVASACLAQPQSSTSGQQALTALDACIARLDPSLDVGYAQVSVRCPTLARSLERSGWAEWLPKGWKEARNELSAGSLTELRTVAARELEASEVSQAPNVARLNEVLAGLGAVTEERNSLWSRFRAWLRAIIERNRPTDRSWLDKMIQHHGRSQTFVDLLTYSALGAVILLAAIILTNELRAAGLLKRHARESSRASAANLAQKSTLSWRNIEEASSSDKPRLLLELLIARLTELRKVPPAGALTVRELTRSVELANSDDRTRLSDIARAAERVRYSAQPVTPKVIDATLEQGRKLLERLDTPA
jgi:hypothetical protein